MGLSHLCFCKMVISKIFIYTATNIFLSFKNYISYMYRDHYFICLEYVKILYVFKLGCDHMIIVSFDFT